eukprot:CAMPEP_0170198232 /NCGR_PEP_ID=MMETSP0040_2-20121228/68341_1 /TAXON_ID=641309 /ORGANISM="Lotharella oceanica, Strain CCMP622" /LENGTH=224 /DNA_ID=CAMNT_0010448129 /DNA_START=143 /DNA_END=817 /DNA_ORIENTATION=+
MVVKKHNLDRDSIVKIFVDLAEGKEERKKAEMLAATPEARVEKTAKVVEAHPGHSQINTRPQKRRANTPQERTPLESKNELPPAKPEEEADLALRLEYLQALQQQNALLRAQLDALTYISSAPNTQNQQLRSAQHELPLQNGTAPNGLNHSENAHAPNGLNGHGMNGHVRTALPQTPTQRNPPQTSTKGPRVTVANLADGLPPKEEVDEMLSTFVAAWHRERER